MSAAEQGATFLALALTLLANTIVLSYLVRRSHWHGWRLAGLVFLMYFGVYSFLSTVEAFAFNGALDIPANLLWYNLLNALLMALVFGPLSVWWLGKWRADPDGDAAPSLGAGLSGGELAIKLALLAAVIYPLLYLGFGYYVAWQNPDVRLLYTGSTEILPVYTQFWNALTQPAWFYPFQILRALLWIGLAWMAMRASKAGWVETGIIVGLNFAILMNAQHLLPNPYMSASVRLSHFIETASSNFIWGFVIVWLLHRSHAGLRQLFRRGPAASPVR